MECDNYSSINDLYGLDFFQSHQNEEPFDPSMDVDLNYSPSNPNCDQRENIDSQSVLYCNSKAINSTISEIRNTIDESKETINSWLHKKKFKMPHFVVTKEIETQTDDELFYSNYTVSVIGSRITISLKNSI